MVLNAESSTRQWLPSHVYPTIAVAAEKLGFLISCYSMPGNPRLGPYVLAVENRDDGRLLGHVGFSPFENEVEVSYAIAELSRGRGYGTEALVSACNWIVDAFAVPQVLAVTEYANVASRRLLDRASFVLVQESVMMFQGHEQLVSRYLWHRAGCRGGA